MTHVVNRFVGSVGAHVDNLFDLGRSAEPSKLWPIELNFLSPHELIEIKPRSNAIESEPIGLGDFVDVINRR